MPNQDYQAKLQQAEALYSEGRIQQALDAFVQLNRIYPDNPEVLNNLGVVSFALGELEQAKDYLDRAANLDPDFREARDNLQAVQAAIKEKTQKQDTLPEDHFPIRTTDEITVCAPPTVKNMTSFVLLEQEEWFEPEIDFVRRIVQPGMTVLDIGAGFGVYALPVAKAVGPDGKVYAFEPNPETRKYLAKSREKNSLDNLEIIPQGLSDAPGSASIEQAETPELSTILTDQLGEIELTTLDAWWHEAGKPDVDLLKLDVNGQEARIIQGGTECLTQTSPVLLIAFTQDQEVNTQIMHSLSEYGYDVCRYLPGPDAIASAQIPPQPDPFFCNLVAVKKDQTEQLAQSGILVTETAPPAPAQDSWQHYLSNLPWTENFLPTWRDYAQQESNQSVMQAINRLCAAQLNTTSAQEKYGHTLQVAQQLIQLFNSPQASGPVALCLARAFADLGLRERSVYVLEQLLQVTDQGQCCTFNTPFLPPLPHMDMSAVKKSPQQWIMARTMEGMISSMTFSSYFSGQQDHNTLKALHKNPERCSEYERKLALIGIKQGEAIQINEASKSLRNDKQYRNKVIWQSVTSISRQHSSKANPKLKNTKFSNIFVLGTGRCGTLSFIAACKHFINYTAAHESRVALLGDNRLNYPRSHIEADNRLTWLLGRLNQHFGKDAFYVHLYRDQEATARSYAKRLFPGGIINAYGDGIIMPRVDPHRATTDPLEIARDMVYTVTENITLFLNDKPYTMIIKLEEIGSLFPEFMNRIGASGDIESILKELKVPKNVSQNKVNINNN